MIFPSPAAPDPARRPESLLMKRFVIKNRRFSRPQPLPTRPRRGETRGPQEDVAVSKSDKACGRCVPQKEGRVLIQNDFVNFLSIIHVQELPGRVLRKSLLPEGFLHEENKSKIEK